MALVIDDDGGCSSRLGRCGRGPQQRERGFCPAARAAGQNPLKGRSQGTGPATVS